jgi:hypothetical protein
MFRNLSTKRIKVFSAFLYIHADADPGSPEPAVGDSVADEQSRFGGVDDWNWTLLEIHGSTSKKLFDLGGIHF